MKKLSSQPVLFHGLKAQLTFVEFSVIAALEDIPDPSAPRRDCVALPHLPIVSQNPDGTCTLWQDAALFRPCLVGQRPTYLSVVKISEENDPSLMDNLRDYLYLQSRLEAGTPASNIVQSLYRNETLLNVVNRCILGSDQPLTADNLRKAFGKGNLSKDAITRGKAKSGKTAKISSTECWNRFASRVGAPCYAEVIERLNMKGPDFVARFRERLADRQTPVARFGHKVLETIQHPSE